MSVRLEPIREASAPERAEAPRGREVEPRRTPLGPEEIRRSLSSAYMRIHKRMIDPVLLDTLSAQVCHETGWGASMHNFNFGGIKGFSPERMIARCRTTEVLGGKEVSIRDGFRAYSSPVEGATDYLAFLESRYPNAMDAARRGDVDGFARALKAGRYFTADEAAYAASMRGIVRRGFDASAAPPLAASTSGSSPPPNSRLLDSNRLPPGSALDAFSSAPLDVGMLPTSGTMMRVMDALRLSATSIAEPSRDDS